MDIFAYLKQQVYTAQTASLSQLVDAIIHLFVSGAPGEDRFPIIPL